MKHLPLTLISLLAAACLQSGNAQDVPETNSPSDGGESVSPTGLPSGLAPGANKMSFLERSYFIIAKIKDNARQVDPFGMSMDPTNAIETPILADQYDDIEEAPVLNNSSLKSALQTLPITGIYPDRQMVVLGARSFTRGSQFGMKLAELTIRLRFEGIRGKSIFFKDMDTQEISSVEFNTKPKEFEPITKGGKAPRGAGIVRMDDLFIVN